MEAARTFLSSPSFPSRTLHKASSAGSALSFHEQAAAVATSFPIASVARHFPTSVLLPEQRDENRPLMNFFKDENILLSLEKEDDSSCTLATQLRQKSTENFKNLESSHAAALPKKALWPSKEAVLLDEDLKLRESDFSHFLSTSSAPEEEVRISVRSTRLLERQSKRRRLPKLEAFDYDPRSSKKAVVKRKVNEGFDPNDPLQFFLWGPETKELLTAKQESELILQVQELMRLEEVKSKLESQFGREPTTVEFAEAVGLSCRVLQAELRSGNTSREKLVNANLRMVVFIAKKYKGGGLSFQDLLQEGSIGLLKSVQKFKPQAGCRFSTYSYWWIRQTIRKAIFQHSRTIRLPENVFTDLAKVKEAKRIYAQEGNDKPSKEELARRVGITVAKLDKLLFNTRMPLSLQRLVWSDQDITLQEVTADVSIENPDVSVEKQLMRQHVRNTLSFLSLKERRIIKLRFGIGGGKQHSLSEIGDIFGMSKERVRQLEARALYKLKQSFGKQGASAYTNLLL